MNTTMPKSAFTLLVAFLLFNSCNGKQVKNDAAKRDTSINHANAFSALFLDSTTLEAFIYQQKLDNSAAEQMRSFYSSRNYQFAWFTEDGLAEQTRAFWNLHNNYINYSKDTALRYKSLHQKMDRLINEDTTINPTIVAYVETELELTNHFFIYASHAYAGKVNPQKLEWYIPRKKVNAVALLDSLIAGKGKNLDEWEPVNQLYKHLYKEVVHYYNIAQSDGWKPIPFSNAKKYKTGDSSLVIQQVKQRLQKSGNYTGNDTSQNFTIQFQSEIKQVQKQFGFKPSGIIDAALIAALNVSINDRIRQILINMERMRWLPEQPRSTRIIVNIPDFKMLVFENTKKVFEMNIVAGKAAHNTVVFSGLLQTIAFSPYWNVPPSIVHSEILPSIRRNHNYLTENNMEQTGYEDGLPVIRQKPGDDNSLGRIKFLFPNDYNIYFHDTPAKELFNAESRAFSHGCIRLADPLKLATWLLRHQPEWTSQAISSAMSADTEQQVMLKEQVPVFISYFTAWVDGEGLLNFREDIYAHDKRMAKHLFEQ